MADGCKNCSKCGRIKWPLRRGLCGRCYELVRARIGFESGYVDAQPVRDRVEQLVAAGVPKRHICRIAKVSRTSMAGLTNGRPSRGAGPARTVQRDTAAAIMAITIPAGTAAHQVVADHQCVPAIGTVRRMQALVAIGYTQSDLCTRLQVTPTNGTHLFRTTTESVIAATAHRVEMLFNELQMKPGPSRAARRRAQTLGWAPPLAWDEDTIDDPATAAATEDGPPMSFADRYLEYRELGYTDVEIARRMGVQLRSLDRQLARAALPAGEESWRPARGERRNDVA